MSHGRITTRFAPSPTGELHLGNARTALFSWLFARHHGGRFVLRIEDTDTERSKEAFTGADGGPEVDGSWLGRGPGCAAAGEEYHQSRRGAIYARHSATLDAGGLTYPCYCTPLELDLSRKAQLAAGRPPRYAGTCRDLSPEARVRKSAQGISPTTRFRVPTGKHVEFDDMVHGPQRFATDDIGDFILRRADGSAAFFFSNAIDDAEMAITHVLRGEDHLTNTPRQLLVLEALELARAHLRPPVAAGGRRRLAPLEAPRRHQRARVPRARLSAGGAGEPSFPAGTLEQRKRRAHTRADGARFSPSSISGVRRRASRSRSSMSGSAMSRTTCRSKRASAGSSPRRRATSTRQRRRAFIAAIRPNVLLPGDVARWREVVFGPSPALDESSLARVREAGPQFFRAAAEAAAANGANLDAIVNAVKAATGAKGQALWKPLRLALTGATEGPELAPLLKAMAETSIHQRLNRFAA